LTDEQRMRDVAGVLVARVRGDSQAMSLLLDVAMGEDPAGFVFAALSMAVLLAEQVARARGTTTLRVFEEFAEGAARFEAGLPDEEERPGSTD
jgi:hypothetical protein